VRSRAPIALLFALLLITLNGGQLAAGSRQPSTQTPSQPQVNVTQQSAQPRFPDAVDFTLRASGFPAREATLLYRPVGYSITSRLTTPATVVSDTLDLRVSLDLSTAGIPPNAEVEYYWSLHDGAGNRGDTPPARFTLVDTRFSWQSLGTEAGSPVAVHWYNGDANFGKFLYDTASGALSRIGETLDTRLDRRAEIWVYATEDDFFGAFPPEQAAVDVGGQSFPELALVLAAIPNDESARSEIKRIVPHELSHLLLYSATRNPYNKPPLWLQEGFATYNEESAEPGYEAALQAAVEAGSLDPLRALTSSFREEEGAAAVAYAQSRSVVEYILESPKYGPERLARTIAAFREGVTYDEALERGLGITTDELDGEWRASLPYQAATPTATPGIGDQGSGVGAAQGAKNDSGVWLVVAGVAVGLGLAVVAFVVALMLRRRVQGGEEAGAKGGQDADD
jgi:hypothetical protein